ncbi:MAG: hypothetical protein GON13_02895 [Nanoarchaeota archaeon]|nr:hypothetical protein [Nanoarchaeota archaeon]
MGVKGQFFVISTIIIVLAVSSTLAYLLFPYGLSVKEINRVSNSLITAKNFVLTLDEGNSLLSEWEEPLLDNKLEILISNSNSSDVEGLFSVVVELESVIPQSIRVLFDGNIIPSSYHNSISGKELLFFESSIPALSDKLLKVYYSSENVSYKKNDVSDVILFDNSTKSVITRFYTAKIDVNNGGVIESIINERTGNELVGSSNGFFNFNFLSENQDSNNFSLINWDTWKTSISQIVSFNLSNDYDINVEVVYEFFNNHIIIRFVPKSIGSSYKEFSVSVHPNCVHDWTVESSNNSVITSFCSNTSSFINKKTGELLSLYSSSESLAFLTPSRDAWAKDITFIDLTQSALANQEGLLFNFTYDDLTNISSVELVTLIDYGNINSDFGLLFKKYFLDFNSVQDASVLSVKESSFSRTLESTIFLEGASIFTQASFSEGVFEKDVGLFDWYKQFWKVTSFEINERIGVDRVNELVSYSFNDFFTDYFATDKFGVEVPSTVIDFGSYKKIYFLVNVSARSSEQFLVYRANNSLTPIKLGKNNLVMQDDSILFFNDFFDRVNISLVDNTVTDLSVNNSVISGVMNDFSISVNNEFKSLSNNDFQVVNTSVTNNNLFSQVKQVLQLKIDNDIFVESEYSFFNDYFLIKRVFVDNSSFSFIGDNNLFWGSNTTVFPIVNNTNMSKVFYEGAWKDVHCPSPQISIGPSDGEYFSVMYWNVENFFMSSFAKVDDDSDLSNVGFCLGYGYDTRRQRPFWSQMGYYGVAGLEVGFVFGGGSRDYAGNFSKSFYDKFYNPLSIFKVQDYNTYTNHFDNSLKFVVSNDAVFDLVNHPVELDLVGLPGSPGSLQVSNNNELLNSALVNTVFSNFIFNNNVKNFDESTPVKYALYNPVNDEFNVSVEFKGSSNVVVNYSITNPEGFVVELGSYNDSKNFEVSNASSGVYVFEFLSNGTVSARSSFNINSTLTQGCLLADKFGFQFNQLFLFYVPKSSSSLSFDLDSPGTGSIWEYSIFDEDMNYVSSNIFAQGNKVNVVYNFQPLKGGTFFWVSFNYTTPANPISWLTVSLNDGVLNCVGSSLNNWINYYSPKVSVLTFPDLPSSAVLDFNVLTNDYFTQSESFSSDLSWNSVAKSVDSGLLFFDYDDLILRTSSSSNWLSSWKTNSFSGFSNVLIVENGVLRNVVSASSDVFNYFFVNYLNKDFFKVLLTNYSFSNSPLTISLAGEIGGDADFWYKFYGYPEELITGTHSINFEDVKCINDFTFFGKKDSNYVLAIIVPCNSLNVGNDVFEVSSNSLSFNLTMIKDNVFYVKMLEDYNWERVEEFIKSFSSVKKSSSKIVFDWNYYSEDLIIN